MQTKYPREAVVAAARASGAHTGDILTHLQDTEGVDPKLAEVAGRAAASLTEQLLLCLAEARDQADAIRDQKGEVPAAQFYGAEAAEIGVAAFSMCFLRAVHLGLLLERGAQAVDEAVPEAQHFTKESLPPEDDFDLFEKRGWTLLSRVNGPFSCLTIDGNVAHCDDGWLALDGEGYPYPVADTIARQNYAVVR